MIYATASATVPKQCMMARKAYNAGIYAISGPAYDSAPLLSGDIGIIELEAGINAVYANKLDDINDPEE